MATVFVVDPVGWHKEFRSWQGTVGEWLWSKTENVQRVAVVEAPGPAKLPFHNRTGLNYSTGELEARIRASKGLWGGRELESTVTALPEHAIWVHEGTPPHVIVPRTAPRLVFFWAKAGRVVHLPQVSHPGMMANPFLWRALRGVMIRT